MTWIADRTRAFDSSGIRKVFELAAKMKDPINLSIGQPDFDVPQPIKDACIDAIQKGKNAYALTQGMPVLRDKLQQRIDAEYGHSDRRVFVASGTSGGLALAMWSLINPGDEVIVFDPYFVMYTSLTQLAGGKPVIIDTYPDFRIDLAKVKAAITPRTKMILLNSPANPTGVIASEAEVRGLAELAAERNICLLSDEIYRSFCYDQPFVSPAKYNPNTLVIDGFSKSHGMTGWRLGFVHGPAEVIDTMLKLQQYTFVCAPQPVQWAGAVAMDVDMSQYVAAYKKKRDFVVNGLKDHYELTTPGGAFYAFPKAPVGWTSGLTSPRASGFTPDVTGPRASGFAPDVPPSATQFVARAIENQLLIIPGNIFSTRDTHFRISYAASDATLARGVEVLQRLAKS